MATSNPGRPEIAAFEPEEWGKIYSFRKGDFHEWLESEEPSNKDSVEHEYPLHFLEPEKRRDLTHRPDALENLYVHEFKQPNKRIAPEKLGKYGPQSATEEQDLKQINDYLKMLNLPAGLLIYACDEAGFQEYVVERSEDREIPMKENIHQRENYNFEERINECFQNLN